MKKASSGIEVGSTHNFISIMSGSIATLALLAMITVNVLANALPLNGVNTGQLSDEIPNLFVPTGLTFAIWGLIYLLLAGYIVTILHEIFRKKLTEQLWEARDGWLFTINSLANIAWVFAWHWRLLPLSLLIMVVILVSLIFLEERNYKRFYNDSSIVGIVENNKNLSIRRFFLTVPINVYLGWICVATIANVTAVLVTAGWTGFGINPQVWTVIVIIAGLAVALGLLFRRKAVAAPSVVVWAYIGIILKRTSVDPDQTRAVWMSAAIAAALILIMLVRNLFGRTKKSSSRTNS